MRSLGTAVLLIALTALSGCGSDGGDADDVPTITTRPSATASSIGTPTASVPTAPSTSAPATTEPPSATATEGTTEAGPSPEPPTDSPGGPTSYDAATARIEELQSGGATTAAASRFSTPDDIVYCLLDDPVIGPSCELRTGFVKDPDVCGGDIAEGVGRIETFEGRARPVCNSDTIREPGADVFRPETVVVATSGGSQCAVEAIGVTCIAPDAHTGFFIGRREYHVF